MSCEYEVEVFEGVNILRVVGELDDYEMGPLRWTFRPILEESSGPVLLDLSGTKYARSSTLGICTWAYKELRGQGRHLVLVPSESVTQILRLTRLDSIFDQADCPEQALSLLLKEVEAAG